MSFRSRWCPRSKEEFSFPLPLDTTSLEEVFNVIAQDVYAQMQIQRPFASSNSGQSGSPDNDPLNLILTSNTNSLAIDKEVLATLIKDVPQYRVKDYLMSLLGNTADATLSSGTSAPTQTSQYDTSIFYQTGEDDALQANVPEASVLVSQDKIVRLQLKNSYPVTTTTGPTVSNMSPAPALVNNQPMDLNTY